MTDFIHRYTRRQAIEDGTLIDITETAKETAITYPVAVTARVWQECVAVPEGVECQDEAGRLWDVLWMLQFAMRASPPNADRCEIALHVRNDNDYSQMPPLVKLLAVCGPGDEGEPVITVMFPDEE